MIQNTINQGDMKSQQYEQLQKAEIRHQDEILLSFTAYERLMKQNPPGSDLYKKSKRINGIKYYEMMQERKRQMFQTAVKANQYFLTQIVNFCQGQQRIKSIEEGPISFSNFSKIKTTVKQFYRQWSDEGKQVNDYAKIVSKAKLYLKTNDKVLAPGSGLGRLVMEFVQAGFSCQGNQVSYFMLYASNFVLNGIEQEKQFKIYPFISSTDYYQNQQDMFRSVLIPDKVASKVVPEDADFSMAAGQFTQVYKQLKEEFNGVATCFFIDTANNIFDYIDTIYETLKPKGIWINYGPLLFHYREVYNEVSIEVSWEVVKAYIQDKFEFLQQNFEQTTYCHDQKSQMGIIYECISFVCKKR